MIFENYFPVSNLLLTGKKWITDRGVILSTDHYLKKSGILFSCFMFLFSMLIFLYNESGTFIIYNGTLMMRGMSFVDMVYLCKKDLTYGFIRYTRKK